MLCCDVRTGENKSLESRRETKKWFTARNEFNQFVQESGWLTGWLTDYSWPKLFSSSTGWRRVSAAKGDECWIAAVCLQRPSCPAPRPVAKNDAGTATETLSLAGGEIIARCSPPAFELQPWHVREDVTDNGWKGRRGGGTERVASSTQPSQCWWRRMRLLYVNEFTWPLRRV